MVSNVELEDLVYTYPDQRVPGIQTLITAKQEFRELASSVIEPVPERGQLYNHQELIKRYMLVYDRLLLIHRTGTGKTCAAFGSSEQFKLGMVNAIVDFINIYLKPQRTHIQHIYVLTKGPTLVEELKSQLAYRCTQFGVYETEKVRDAPTEVARKGNITRAVKKYYTVEGHGRFASQLLNKNFSDEQIIEQFSNSMFIIDEAHNIKAKPIERATGASEREELEEEVMTEREQESQRRMYSLFWQIFHLIQRSKVMMLTATPMVDNVSEIIPLINLILPRDVQMPEFTNLSAVTVQDMEPYFRGIVSYIRELDTGIVPVYQGNVVEAAPYEIGGRLYPPQTIIYTSQMSQRQQTAYELSEKVEQTVHLAELQAANFIFPDGSYGDTGFEKYTVVRGTDDYEPTPELRAWISDLAHLRDLSAKFPTIIQLCRDNPGNCFCYSNFKKSGAVMLGLCFQALRFELFMETQSIFVTREVQPGVERATRPGFSSGIPRVAILTSDTPKARISAILDTFNSYENRHGQYLKVLIGSPKTRLGLNLSNVVQIHLVGPSWNQSNTYQAISRAIRALSHVNLLNEEIARLMAEGLDEQTARTTARIPVTLYQHAATKADGTSIDTAAYQLSEIKDIEIKRMERIMKQIAIDCHIHKTRNVRPTDQPGSPICDYDVCDYQCVNPSPTQIDYSSYDVLYTDDLIANAMDDIKTLFMSAFSFSLDQLYQTLVDYKPRYLDMALERLVTDKTSVLNRYGFRNYIQTAGNTIYLQSDYPFMTVSDRRRYALATYTETLIGVQSTKLLDYVTKLQIGEQVDISAQLSQIPPTDPRFNEMIDQLSLEGKVRLLENALYQYAVEQVETDYIRTIYERYQPFIFFVPEPISQIEQAALARTGQVKKRGRPPKIPGKVTIKKIKPTAVSPGPSPREGTGETVIIHILYGQTFDRSAYNVTSKFNKAEGKIRILKPSEGTGWRDVNPDELLVYNSIIQIERQSVTSEFDQCQIYGSILQDGIFRIHDRTTENRELSVTDSRYAHRGKICSTWKKPELVNVLWKLGLWPQPETPVTLTREALSRYLSERGVTLKTEKVVDFPLEKLQFFYRWYITEATIGQMCDTIRTRLKWLNLIRVATS